MTEEYWTHICSRILGAGRNALHVTGRCELRIEGACEIGRDVYIRSRTSNSVQISVHRGGRLRIGDGVFINQGVRLVATKEIEIGDNVLVGDDALLLDSDFHGVAGEPVKAAPIHVEKDSWIGSRAIILKGVTIGEGSVVGAGVVVTRSVPAATRVYGAKPRVRSDGTMGSDE